MTWAPTYHKDHRNGHVAKAVAPKARFAPMTQVGVSGAAIYGGFLQSVEKDPRLQGTRRYTTYSEIMANVSIVATGARFITRLITKAAWTFDPADDSPEAEEFADFCEEVLHDMLTPWHRVVRRASMHQFHGFAIAEWTAKRREDGRVGFLDVDTRPQQTIEQWDVDEAGTVSGIGQRSPQDGMLLWLPRAKVLYTVDDSLSDSPEGLGVFRHLVEPAARLERFQQLEVWGFETDLRGIPVGKAPLSELAAMVEDKKITAEQFEAIVKPMNDFLKHHVRSPVLSQMIDSMVYTTADASQSPSGPPKWGIELLKHSSTSHETLAAAITRINQEMARLLGVEHLLLGSDGSGSLALSSDKSKNIALLIDSVLVEIVESVKQDLLRPLARMNGVDESLIPTPKTETAQWRDIEQVTAGLRDMATAGALLAPDDPAIAEVRAMLGLSAPITLNLATDAAIGGSASPANDQTAGTAETDSMAGNEAARTAEVAAP